MEFKLFFQGVKKKKPASQPQNSKLKSITIALCFYDHVLLPKNFLFIIKFKKRVFNGSIP